MPDNIQHENNPLILITGASGYVGGRLLKELERKGKRLRCFARRPEFLKSRVEERTEIVKGDIFDTEALQKALAGVHTAYYFIHALAGKGSFEENDRKAAAGFASAARAANLKKIIYLGGLGEGDDLSHHLSSRHEVGEILRSSSVLTVEFRASIIIGSGSLSFEMVRALVQKLPIMTTPYWVRALAQPIAIEDVISYLCEVLDMDIQESTIFEIGGKDRVSYEQIMREYIRIRKLKRLIIPLPFLTPWLSSLWLAFVTPLYFRVGRRLIEGVKNETVLKDNKAEKFFRVKPRGIRESIQRALENEDQEFAETRWSDALPLQAFEHHWKGVRFGSRLIDTRSVRVSFSPQEAFRPIQCIGGRSGWSRYDWLLNLRGSIDQIIGGVGHRRGRADPRCLRVGDTIDFWRLEKLEQDKLIRLSAEMKMPGRGWLQYEVDGDESGSVVRQTALFDPVGIAGLIYWYSLYPFHQIIFKDMLQKIVSEMKALP